MGSRCGFTRETSCLRLPPEPEIEEDISPIEVTLTANPDPVPEVVATPPVEVLPQPQAAVAETVTQVVEEPTPEEPVNESVPIEPAGQVEEAVPTVEAVQESISEEGVDDAPAQ